MIRRTFFQFLGAPFLPRPLLAVAEPVQATCTTHEEAPPQPPAPIHHPEWLHEWREIPKLEVFAKDLPDHGDPHQRAVAEVILAHIQSGQPFTFRYHGGSEPGATRTVLPTLLFHLDYYGHFYFCVEDPSEIPDPDPVPIYLLGWCQTRQAARYFRLDRMQVSFPRPCWTA
jgi:hypothetical protein